MIAPSVDVYNLEIEVLSPTCIGGAGEDGRTEYESFEYVIDRSQQRIYFVNENDILNLLSAGLIKEEDLELEYYELINRIRLLPGADKYIRSLKMSYVGDNKLLLYRFASIKEVNLRDAGSARIAEKYVIPGSTVKGVLRTGYAAKKIRTCSYKFGRVKNKKRKNARDLKLFSAAINGGNHKEDDKQVLDELFSLSDYEVQVNIAGDTLSEEEEKWISLEEYNEMSSEAEGEPQNKENLSKEQILNILFRNIVCCDFELTGGEVAVEKGIRIDRRINKKNAKQEKIPTYFEAAQPGTKFCGRVYYKNDTLNEDKQLSIVSIHSRNSITPVEEALEGLKEMGTRIAEVERTMLCRAIKDQEIESFYDMLKAESEKEGVAIFKLGYAGILSKSWMVFDEKKIRADDTFLPYTLLVSSTMRVPMGWVKIRWEWNN